MRDDDTPGLRDDEYERLRQAAPTHRADLVLRLGGEAGLRPADMASLCPGDLTATAHDGQDQYLVSLEDREAYVPRSVERDIRQYANSHDVDPSEELFSVSTRRIQMLVDEVGNAATDGDADRLADVSARDLRGYFARRRLKDGVSPAVLLAIGGWSRLDALAPYIQQPEREAVLEAFAPSAEAGLDRSVVRQVRAAADELMSAATTAAVRERVAEGLTAGDRYTRAWVEPPREDAPVPDQVVQLRDRLLRDTPPLYAQAHTSGQVQTTSRVSQGVVFVVPVSRRDGPDETLVVEANANSTGEEQLLSLLGSMVGWALTVTDQRRGRHSDTVLRLTFRYAETPLTGLSETLDCRLSLVGAVPSDGLVLFLDVEDVSPETFRDEAVETRGLTGVRLVSEYGAGARFEVVVGDDSPLLGLIEAGATIRNLIVSGGQADVTVETLTDADARALQTAAERAVSSLELRSKRVVDGADRSIERISSTLGEALTDRQAAALQAAHLAGYFKWPRESTAETVADSLDVSSPTFHQHLRKAQQKLLDVYFEVTHTP